MITDVHQQLRAWGDWAKRRPLAELDYARIRYDSTERVRSSASGENETALQVDALLAEFRRRWPEHEKAVRAKYLHKMTDPEGAKYCRVSRVQYTNYIDRAHFWFVAMLERSAA